MSRHSCWNCDYRLEGDPSRCPRCGMPLAGTDKVRPPAAASSGAGPSKTASPRRRPSGKQPSPPPLKAPSPAISVNAETARSTASRFASGAGKGLRVAAAGAGRGLLASFGIARKAVATGAALSVRTARLVGSAAGGVASGVRSGGTKLVAYREQRSTRALDGDVLQHENIRTITDVAERLLREARDENARLAARVSALEAAIGTDRRIGTTSAAAKPTAAAARSAATRKPKALASRAAPARVEKGARREPATGVRPVITLEAKAEKVVPVAAEAAAPTSAPPRVPPRRKAAARSANRPA